MWQTIKQNRLLILAIMVMIIPLVGVILVRATLPTPAEIRAEAEADIAKISEAIAQNPDNVVAYINRCASYAEAEQFDAAMADCNQALQLSPDNGNALLNRGLVQEQMGNYEGAIADYERLLVVAEADMDAVDLPVARLREVQNKIGFLKSELARN
jgi:tetratricopeptide (TPR) repeat protein